MAAASQDGDYVLLTTRYNSNQSSDLWVSDGSTATLLLSRDSIPELRALTAFGEELLVVMKESDTGAELWRSDGVHGYELWRSDGTAVGTVLVADLRPGPIGSGTDQLTTIGGTVYFSASSDTAGTALWRTNGTLAGTTKLAEIAPGPESANPRAFTQLGDQLFFLADDATTGLELHSIGINDSPEPAMYPAYLPEVIAPAR